MNGQGSSSPFGSGGSGGSGGPQDPNVVGGGWTSFTPSSDTRMIYVSSSSGNDQNDGLTTSTPKRTVAAGMDLLRAGYPDWLLLRRGDTWHESLGHWLKSGRSVVEPMLVSAYGTAVARPSLQTGSTGGFWTVPGGGSPPTIDNLALVGIEFRADTFSGTGDCVGAMLLQPGTHFLIEDCKFDGYSTNLVFQGYGGRHNDFRLRRSVVVDAHCVHDTGSHSQGLYAYAVDDLLIEECVFDHNGWSETVPGAGADIFSHNLYIDNGNTGVVVRGNTIANASSHGLQLRCGGSVTCNLFVRNSIALLVGGGNSPEPGGVTADVRGNVIMDGKNIDAANPRGWGMLLANVASGHVSHNVIANNTLGTQPSAISLEADPSINGGAGVGIHDLQIESNIVYNWGGSINVEGSAAQLSNIHLRDNDVQNELTSDALLDHFVASNTSGFHSSGNRFHSQQMPYAAWTEIALAAHSIDYWMAQVGDTTSTVQQAVYVDPNRSAASYNAALGGVASLGAFLSEARQQSWANWRSQYMAVCVNRYVRTGF